MHGSAFLSTMAPMMARQRKCGVGQQKILRIRYLRRVGDKAGANVCRNIGIREAAADFVVFLNSDDLLMPQCLARRLEVAERNVDIDFAVFQARVFIATPGDTNYTFDQELVGDDLLRFLFFEAPWIITGPIWRKAALAKLDGFDESLPSWQDIDLHVRAILSACRYIRFDEPDHHVRWQLNYAKTSILQRRSPDHLKAAEQMLLKFERLLREGPGVNWVRQRALCSLYFFIAECWTDAGQLSEALRCWALVRDRKLASRLLYGTGALLLALRASGDQGNRLGGRISHKWKGWMRFRTNPELVADQQ